ncbi:hypothetical protein DRH27_04645, partial [Candidatus Falkowbacteria bacterium]
MAYNASLIIMNDMHHTDRPDQSFQFMSSGPRFYSEGLTDIQTAVDAAITEEVDAIIQLGDAVDIPDDPAVKSKSTLVSDVQTILHSESISAYNVMGN